MKPILGCDVDSTVWDTGAWVREATLAVTGQALDPASIATWTGMLDAFGEEATTEIHARVNSPERMRERDPYPSATNALRYLQEEHEIRIHFITRVSVPKRTGPPLEAWLREQFGPRVGMTMITDEKLPVLQKLGAFGMIDDRPDTLESVAAAGLWCAAKVQPWNEELVSARRNIHGFRDWREVPKLLLEALGDVPCGSVQTSHHERIWS